MPHYRLGFIGNYIAAVEFGGKEPTLTIRSIALEELEDEKQGKKKRWVAHFEGKERGWVINRTNAILLAGLFNSSDINDWVGKRVTLYAENVKIDGETMPGIRVRGGPDLGAAIDVRVKLAKKRPNVVRLIPTGKSEQP